MDVQPKCVETQDGIIICLGTDGPDDSQECYYNKLGEVVCHKDEQVNQEQLK